MSPDRTWTTQEACFGSWRLWRDSTMVGNQLVIDLRVLGVVWEEDGIWVAGFPRLEVFSQGQTPEEAKNAAREALGLWVRSCLDRGTLDAALRELNWHASKGDDPEAQSGTSESVTVSAIEPKGEPWEGHVAIPAYQASAFLSASARQ